MKDKQRFYSVEELKLLIQPRHFYDFFLKVTALNYFKSHSLN